ncbi:hypothetical protein VPH35_055246 [Triticum aestivum]
MVDPPPSCCCARPGGPTAVLVGRAQRGEEEGCRCARRGLRQPPPSWPERTPGTVLRRCRIGSEICLRLRRREEGAERMQRPDRSTSSRGWVGWKPSLWDGITSLPLRRPADIIHEFVVA